MPRKRRTSPTIEGYPYAEVQTYIETYTTSKISEATANIISSGMLVGEQGPEGESWMIPGPAGFNGATGSTGPQGPSGIGFPGTDGIAQATSVAANSYIDWYGQLRLDSTDFLVGGASANTSLSIQGEGEIGIAG